MDGQISIFEYIESKTKRLIFRSCDQCVCRKCLYWWSRRCPHGGCYDDFRSRQNPYDKAHPGEPPRTAWSNWKKPGEQAHWCRGGTFYPVTFCDNFVKYEGVDIQECIDCNISVYQDGYVDCTLKESIGCEECIARKEGREREKVYGCQWMTENGCEAHINALSLMLDNILEGSDDEMCKEQCCIGCTKSCGYRCGQTY